MRTDYYQLLDVEPTASAADIKSSYYRLAKKYHPDHNANSPEAEERFKLVAEAYRVLGDEDRRRDYDAWLERHNTYRSAPELADMVRRGPVNMPEELARMPRRTRISVRHARERRAEREERRQERRERANRTTAAGNRRNATWDYTPRLVPRIFLRRKTSRPSVLHLVLVYGMAFFLFMPLLTRGCHSGGGHRPAESADASPREPYGFSGHFSDVCGSYCDTAAPGLRQDPQQFTDSLRRSGEGLLDSLQEGTAGFWGALKEAPSSVEE